MRPCFLVLLFLSILPAHAAWAQVPDTVNQVDELGRKQGWWQMNAPGAGQQEEVLGPVIEEGSYADGRRSGVWTRYWPNGTLKSRINYVNGMPRGAYTLYYADGKPQEQGTWDLDRNTGEFKRWHANGKLAQEFLFNAYGTRNGAQKYYHENGQLAVEVRIVEGREEGTLKRYFPNGELQETAELSAGSVEEGSFRSFRPKGPVQEERPLADAAPAPARSAQETTNATDFRAEGYNVLYDTQHRLAQQGHYRKGRLWDGKVYKYDRNGILYQIEVYVNGRYAGKAPFTVDDL